MEDKFKIIIELKGLYGIIVMFGDGVNDVLVFVVVDIGIVMGEGIDIVIDVVDVVFMKNDLNKFVYIYRVLKKLRLFVW